MAPSADKGKANGETTTYSTAGTVSSPLDLDNVKGEHQSVNVSGSGSRRKVVTPKVKVTLTSLTPNNVSIPSLQRAIRKGRRRKLMAVWYFAENQLGRFSYCLFRQVL
jgi:hypothetical protein